MPETTPPPATTPPTPRTTDEQKEWWFKRTLELVEGASKDAGPLIKTGVERFKFGVDSVSAVKDFKESEMMIKQIMTDPTLSGMDKLERITDITNKVFDNAATETYKNLVKWTNEHISKPLSDAFKDDPGPGPGGPGPGSPGPGPGGPGPGPGGPGPGSPGPGSPGPGSPGPGTPGPGGPGPGGPGPGIGWPPKPPPIPRDPVVLDLDGDGLELVSVANSQAHFDFHGDGFAEATGWLKSDDGFLVRDLDHNGRIETTSELFGNDNQDGFAVLATLDSNHDGKIDAADDGFADLQVWRDLDGDGQTDVGEMSTLAAAGVTSISLATLPANQTVEGNLVLLTGQYGKADGTTGHTGAVLFQTDQVLSQWVKPDGFAIDPAVYDLPILKGYGHLADLDYAFTNSGELREAMRGFVFNLDGKTGTQIRDGFIDFLYKWAGVSDVSATAHGANIDGRHQAFLEKFLGGLVEQAEPTALYAAVLEQTFQDIVDAYLTRVLAQSASAIFVATGDTTLALNSPFIRLVNFDYQKDSDKFFGDFNATLKDAFEVGPSLDQDLYGYYEILAAGLRGLRIDLYNGDRTAFAAVLDAAGAELHDLALQRTATTLVLYQSVNGTADGETVQGTAATDVLHGGAGQDILIGGLGDDTYVFTAGDGVDRITENGGFLGSNDELLLPELTAGAAVLSRDGNDLLIDRGGGDIIRVVGQFGGDIGAYIERFVFKDAVYTPMQIQERLLTEAATAGNDTVVGFRTADTLTGGAGDDVLMGGEGGDTYLHRVGDDKDHIVEDRSYDGTVDKLVFGAGLNLADLKIDRDGASLTLSFTGQAGSVQIDSVDDAYGAGIEQIVFNDGTTWSRADLQAAYLAQQIATGATSITGFESHDDVLKGTDGNDSLSGLAGTDTFTGGKGDDLLNGGAGADTFFYNVGDGADHIVEGRSYDNLVDKLILGTVLNASDLHVARDGGTLTLTFNGQTGSIQLDTMDDAYGGGVEQIVFGDGTIWSRADLQTAYLAQQVASGATSLTGFDTRVDVLTGTAGNDTLSGLDGADTLTGGKGDDFVIGGGGADTIVYNLGDGNDRLIEARSYDNTVDKLVLGAGLTVADTHVVKAGADFILTFGVGGSIHIVGQDDQYGGGVEQVVFSDGTIWGRQDLITAYQNAASTPGNDTIIGTSGRDVLAGGQGDDLMNGGDGADTYYYGVGDGNDHIVEGRSYDNTVDKLVLGSGLNAADLQIARSGATLTLSFNGQAGSIQLDTMDDAYGAGIEQIVFGDGAIWSRADLLAAYVAQQTASGATAITGFDVRADILTGTIGNDTLSGLGGADTFTGGKGDDVLNGGDGADTFIYNAGDGNDRIVEGQSYDNTIDRLVLGAGLNASNLHIERSGGTLTLSFAGQTGSIQVDLMDNAFGGGIEQVVFGDEATWSRADLLGAYIAQQTTAGATSMTGFDVRADVLTGTTGNDTLAGLGGADTLTGGKGDDVLTGGDGADTYVFNVGDGNDRIVEARSYDSTVDKLVLGVGLNAADLRITQMDADLRISFVGRSDAILIVGGEDAYGSGLEQIAFADGTVWSRQDLLAAPTALPPLVPTVVGTSAAETLIGTSGADVIFGKEGNDVLRGGSGSDAYIYNLGDGADTIYEAPEGGEDRLVLGDGITASNLVIARGGSTGAVLSFVGQAGSIALDTQFYGSGWGIEKIQFADGTSWTDTDFRAAYLTKAQTSGNDTILGFDNTGETIQGGLGDDTLRGYGGADTYVYNLGDGIDTIYEGPTGGVDRIVFGAGIATTDIIVSRGGANGATISFAGQTGQIRLDTQFYGSGWGVEQFVFADGATWSEADLRTAYLAKAATSGADTILGFGNIADTLQGGLGDDVLRGYGGGDTYVYNLGDGADTIYERPDSGADKLVFGAGISASDALVTRGGDHAYLTFVNAAGSIKLDTQFYGSGWGVESIVFADGTTWTQTDLINKAWIRGDATANTLFGGSGADKIDGGDGNDTIDAGAGNDRIVGGIGADTLTGGAGADVFVFSSGFGKDTVKDFKQADGDKLEVQGLFTDLADVQAHSQQVGGDVLITYDVDNIITLKGVTLSTLTQADFVFA